MSLFSLHPLLTLFHAIFSTLFLKEWNLYTFQRSDIMKRLFLNGFIIYHLPIEAYFVLFRKMT